METLYPFGAVDACDVLHVGLGVVSPFLPNQLGMLVGAGLTIYEWARAKPATGKFDALTQYGIGYAIGALLKGKVN